MINLNFTRLNNEKTWYISISQDLQMKSFETFQYHTIDRRVASSALVRNSVHIIFPFFLNKIPLLLFKCVKNQLITDWLCSVGESSIVRISISLSRIAQTEFSGNSFPERTKLTIRNWLQSQHRDMVSRKCQHPKESQDIIFVRPWKQSAFLHAYRDFDINLDTVVQQAPWSCFQGIIWTH